LVGLARKSRTLLLGKTLLEYRMLEVDNRGKSRIVVEYTGKEYGIVLAVQGLFLEEVKKMTVEKLKLGLPGLFHDVGYGCLTF